MDGAAGTASAVAAGAYHTLAIQAVPEPTSAALGVAALLCLDLLARRRRWHAHDGDS